MADSSSRDEKNAVRQAAASAAQSGFHPTAREMQTLKGEAKQTLDRLTPILTVSLQPTNVDPRKPGGAANMKRVLNAILNDENAKVTIKDDDGNSLGAAGFSRIYPQVQGPFRDGSIQVEYHEQATLGWLGDVFWSMGWFLRHGVLGIPRQTTSALLQTMGVSFLLERYYQLWLCSLLDQLHQQGVLPGYTDPATHDDLWEVSTEIAGRNIIVRPRVPAAPPE